VATKSPSEKKKRPSGHWVSKRKKKKKTNLGATKFQKKKKNLTLDYEKLNGHQVFFLRKQ